MSEELDKEVLTADQIDSMVDYIKTLRPRMQSINGFYWWAKDRNSQWVWVEDESQASGPLGASESHDVGEA